MKSRKTSSPASVSLSNSRSLTVFTRKPLALASRYAGRPVRYFGDVIPAAFADREVPVLCRIRPRRIVTLDATGDEERP